MQRGAVHLPGEAWPPAPSAVKPAGQVKLATDRPARCAQQGQPHHPVEVPGAVGIADHRDIHRGGRASGS